MVSRKGLSVLHTCIGQKRPKTVRSCTIRAFQREPNLLSFIAERLPGERYEMELEGKYCTMGRLWLSWQWRPSQGVIDTASQALNKMLFEGVTRMCTPWHAQLWNSSSLFVLIQRIPLPTGSAGQCSLAAQEVDLAIEPNPSPGQHPQLGFTTWSCPHFSMRLSQISTFRCFSSLQPAFHMVLLLPIHRIIESLRMGKTNKIIVQPPTHQHHDAGSTLWYYSSIVLPVFRIL